MTNTQFSTEETTSATRTGVLELLEGQTQIQFHVPAGLTFRPGILQTLEASTQIQFQLPAQKPVSSVAPGTSLTSVTLFSDRQFAHRQAA